MSILKFTLSETISNLKKNNKKHEINYIQTMLDLFEGGEEIPISDELIEELVIDGWDRNELMSAQKSKFTYNISRESLVSPAKSLK